MDTRGEQLFGGRASAEFGKRVAEPVRTERDLLKSFFGRNSEAFLSIADNLKQGKKWGWSHINLAVFFLGFPWFFYRKLYLEGALLILIPVTIGFLFPELLDKAQLGLAAAMSMMANSYYIERAQKRVGKIEALDIADDQKDKMIIAKGGVSFVGGGFGTLILLALAAVMFYKPDLPKCDSIETQTLIKQLINSNAKQNGGSSIDGVSGFRSDDAVTDDQRQCSFEAQIGGKIEAVPFFVEWQDKQNGIFQVRIGSAN